MPSPSTKNPTKTPSKLDKIRAHLAARLAKSPTLGKAPSLAKMPR